MATEVDNSRGGPAHASAAAELGFAAAVQAWGPPDGSRGDGEDAEVAVEWLRRMQRAEATVDLSRIHPTWLVRALQGESPAVRAVVAAYGPSVVRRDLFGSGALPEPDRPPHPEVLAWVLALWTERLVGGAVECADDSPAIVALSRTSPRECYRLLRTAGLIKLALARMPDRVPKELAEWVQDRLGTPRKETQISAIHDFQRIERIQVHDRRRAPLLGLVTLARLLAVCEPFRTRWALQHLPYPIVKLIRTLTSQASSRAMAGLPLESLILRAAWARLILEGRIDVPFPSDLEGSRNER